jgi:hypothetical protein
VQLFLVPQIAHCDTEVQNSYLCNKLGNVIFFRYDMIFVIEATAEIKNMPCTEKNGFSTYCTHDFFYRSLENKSNLDIFNILLI